MDKAEMSTSEFIDRIVELREEELQQPEHLIWFSFADNGFKGAVIMMAHGITTGLTKINLLGINPGGEVLAIDIPQEAVVEPKFIGRLLSKEEIENDLGGAVSYNDYKKQTEEDH